MARYTGPKHRLARKEGINVLDKTSASLQRRLNIPPGVHGKKRKKTLSEYGHQLREKQRAKSVYGLLEKQFKNLVQKIQGQKGETGEMILQALETRLDNVVYRLGFAKTRYQARQFVGHGHIMVNDKKVTIPSYAVKQGDEISLSSKMQKVVIEEKEESILLPFLEKEKTVGKLARMPKREDLQILFDTQLIIEYYSR